jgi:hypothetical protein
MRRPHAALLIVLVVPALGQGASFRDESDTAFANWFNRKFATTRTITSPNAPFDPAADASLIRLSDGTGGIKVADKLISIPVERARALMLAELKKEMRQQLRGQRERQELQKALHERQVEGIDLREVAATARPTANPTDMPTSSPRYHAPPDWSSQAGRLEVPAARVSAVHDPTPTPTQLAEVSEVHDPTPTPTQLPTGTPRYLAREMRASGWGRGADEWVKGDKAFRVWGLYSPAGISPSELARLGLVPSTTKYHAVTHTEYPRAPIESSKPAEWEQPVAVSSEEKRALGLVTDDADVPVWSLQHGRPQLAVADRQHPIVGEDDSAKCVSHRHVSRRITMCRSHAVLPRVAPYYHVTPYYHVSYGYVLHCIAICHTYCHVSGMGCSSRESQLRATGSIRRCVHNARGSATLL